MLGSLCLGDGLGMLGIWRCGGCQGLVTGRSGLEGLGAAGKDECPLLFLIRTVPPMKTIFTGLCALSLAGAVFAVSATASLSPAVLTTVSGESTFVVDPSHSSVVFKTQHVGVSEFFGRFNVVGGEIVYDESDMGNCSVLIEIPVNSLDSNSEGRDGHLKSADFFSAKEYPTMVFESSSVKKDGDNLLVTGTLSLRDQTKEVTATVTKIGEGEAMGAYRVGFTAHFTIDMREFGFQFVKKQPGAVGPEVELWVALELKKQ
ncbi:MAG: polyisoprenoid-binding protein YceI [Planctomycetota bacterium]